MYKDTALINPHYTPYNLLEINLLVPDIRMAMQLRVTFLADYELANLQHHCQWLHLNYC